MHAPNDAQDPFEDLLAVGCSNVDSDTLCVDRVLEQIQSAANRRVDQLESSSKNLSEDEEIAKIYAFFSKLNPQTEEEVRAENITSQASSEILLAAPIRFSRKLRKASPDASNKSN